jgi:hypothetical protein
MTVVVALPLHQNVTISGSLVAPESSRWHLHLHHPRFSQVYRHGACSRQRALLRHILELQSPSSGRCSATTSCCSPSGPCFRGQFRAAAVASFLLDMRSLSKRCQGPHPYYQKLRLFTARSRYRSLGHRSPQRAVAIVTSPLLPRSARSCHHTGDVAALWGAKSRFLLSRRGAAHQPRNSRLGLVATSEKRYRSHSNSRNPSHNRILR